MADPKRNRHVSGDILDYIQDRKKKDPAFARRLDEEFDKLKIARQIKAVREAHRLSQAELAVLVGTKQPAIARLESGRVVPRIDLLHKIAAAVGLRLDVQFVPEERAPVRKRASRAR